MRRKLALLIMRVARWLAPQLFPVTDSIDKLYRRATELRNEYKAFNGKERDSVLGWWYLREIKNVDATLKDMERRIYERGQRVDPREYELMKVEVQANSDDVLRHPSMRNCEDFEAQGKYLAKRKLFEQLAAGLAESGEIEKFIYWREYDKVRTIGIRFYFRHDDVPATPNVGNYTKDLKRRNKK